MNHHHLQEQQQDQQQQKQKHKKKKNLLSPPPSPSPLSSSPPPTQTRRGFRRPGIEEEEEEKQEEEEEDKKPKHDDDDDDMLPKKPKRTKQKQLLSLAPGAYDAHFEDEEEIIVLDSPSRNNNQKKKKKDDGKKTTKKDKKKDSMKKKKKSGVVVVVEKKKEDKDNRPTNKKHNDDDDGDDDDDLTKKKHGKQQQRQQQMVSLAPGVYESFDDEDDEDEDEEELYDVDDSHQKGKASSRRKSKGEKKKKKKKKKKSGCVVVDRAEHNIVVEKHSTTTTRIPHKMVLESSSSSDDDVDDDGYDDEYDEYDEYDGTEEQHHPGALAIKGINDEVGRREDNSIQNQTADGEDDSSSQQRITATYQDAQVTHTEENLVVAAELAEPAEIVEGTPMEVGVEEMEANYKHTIQRQRRNTYILFGFLLVVITGILLGVFLSLKRKDDPELEEEEEEVVVVGPTETTTLVPTTTPTTETPTTAPTTTMNLAISLLSPYIPDIPNSTIQEDALRWIASDDNGFIQKQDADRLLDRYVMAILYYSTSGRAWDNKRYWLSKFSVCTWSIDFGDGFVCDNDNDDNGNDDNQSDGRVRRLLLGYNNLQGTVPTEVGLLTELEELWLGENQLIGTIPTELGRLKNLTRLELNQNSLTGNIPSEMGDLTRLTQLKLNGNSLMGHIPVELEQLTNLKTLRLGHSSQYDDPVPESIIRLCDETPGILCDGFSETSSPTASPAPTTYCPGAYFDLRLKLDSYGEETSWDIRDEEEGSIVHKSPDDGYPGGEGGTSILESGCLEEGFYTFTLYDSLGDGLFEPGSYELSIGGIVALSGGYDDFFDFQVSISFAVPFILSPSPTMSPSLTLHPTEFCPVSNRFQLSLTLDPFGEEVSWDIQNDEGDIVYESPSDGYPADQSGLNFIENGCLYDDGSYIFNLYDSFGDGLGLDFSEDYDYGYGAPESGSFEFSVGGIVILAAEAGNDLLDYYELTQSFDVPASNCPGTNIFQLHLTLDGNGTQTSWDIKNEDGEKVFESPVGAYPDGIGGPENHIERGCLVDGSYNFTLYDTQGDGLFLSCNDDYGYDYGYEYYEQYGCGSYKLLIGGVVIASGEGEELGQFRDITVPFDVPYQVDDIIID